MATCYAALEDRLLVVGGSGRDWTLRERLKESDIECVAAAPAAPERIFVGTVETGLERSTDGGDSWEATLHAGDRVTAVTVDPNDPDVIWAGTEPSEIHQSTDGGETWTERVGLTALPSADNWSFPPRPDTHHVRWIAVNPADSDRIYVAIEAGAFLISTDGGDTWIDRPQGSRYDNHTIATHPATPERVYAAAGDGYAESFDRGETWHHPQSGLEHRYVWSVAVAPDNPDEVLVSVAAGARSAHDPTGTSYVYRRLINEDSRTDAGEPLEGAWDLAMDGLPGPEGMARAVLASDDSRTFALTNHGLFVRIDTHTWDLVSTAWPGDYARQVPAGLAVV